MNNETITFKRKHVLWAVGVAFLIVIAFTGILFKLVLSADKCTGNPFRYTIDKLHDSSDADWSCVCGANDPEYSPIIFDKHSVRPFIGG